MIRLIISRILNRKIISLIMVIAFLSIFFLIPLGSQYTLQSQVSVKNTLEKHGRGSYDILLRPSDSRTEIEKTIGIVEENYVGDGKGGISISEWEEIKDNPDIEVAAPVASLGYFTGRQASIILPPLEHPARFKWQFYTSDGLNKYPLGEKQILTYFDNSKPDNLEYVWYPQGQDMLAGKSMYVVLPPSYHLLTAIDPESEKQLTGIDFSDLYADLDDPKFSLFSQMRQNYNNPPVIKVLQRSEIDNQIHMELSVEKLDVSLADYKKKLGLTDEQILLNAYEKKDELGKVVEELNKEPGSDRKDFDFDLSIFQRPFESVAMKIRDDFKVETSNGSMYSFNTSQYYTAQKIDYKFKGEQIQVEKVQEGNPPSYKEVVQKGAGLEESDEVPFMILQTGEFTASEKKGQLASSPLGIYSTSTTTTSKGESLTPTSVPGSFVPAPSSGVTTLDSAELVKGDKPIDAIRIRIDEITKYDASAQAKIENVAKDLLEAGYEVDIVAGSSFKEQQLEVEGIGQVTEPWTTLGVAQAIETSWNKTINVALSLFFLFGLSWLMARLVFEKNILKAENQTLFLIGWSPKKILQRNYSEQVILQSLAFLTAFILLFFVFEKSYAFLYAMGLFLFSLVITYGVLAREEKSRVRLEAYKNFSSIRHYLSIIAPTMLTLFTSTFLLIVQMAIIGETISEMDNTTMGQFINNQTLTIQMTIVAMTIILTVVSMIEGVHSLILKRKDEFNMYHTIGWTKSTILKHFLKEVLLWVMIAIFAGVIGGYSLLVILKVPLLWCMIGLLFSLINIIIPILTVVLAKKYEND
ncbi:hypothetical protein AC622_16130 [Bacillus sp. FJAT-27916]|uniref:ABC transporter permease n=1 Tax=Bacillus sp. FJAT-27916 TaxID=1679169 RepID=UPI0006715403|nr:ABC transporter permease [Bacillus sp. FJAT-27916]KMY45557.1 hypothetical protein AC622_16130 [Bacillus sp. FJAT-27916]